MEYIWTIKIWKNFSPAPKISAEYVICENKNKNGQIRKGERQEEAIIFVRVFPKYRSSITHFCWVIYIFFVSTYKIYFVLIQNCFAKNSLKCGTYRKNIQNFCYNLAARGSSKPLSSRIINLKEKVRNIQKSEDSRQFLSQMNCLITIWCFSIIHCTAIKYSLKKSGPTFINLNIRLSVCTYWHFPAHIYA